MEYIAASFSTLDSEFKCFSVDLAFLLLGVDKKVSAKHWDRCNQHSPIPVIADLGPKFETQTSCKKFVISRQNLYLWTLKNLKYKKAKGSVPIRSID